MLERLLKRIEIRFLGYYPGNPGQARKRAGECLIACLIFCLVLILFLSFFHVSSIFYVAYSAVLLFFLCIRYLYGRAEEEKCRLLTELLPFLSRFGTNYLAIGSIGEAMEEAERPEHRRLMLQTREISQILAMDFGIARTQRLERYISGVPLSFFGELALVFHLTSEWGDVKKDGKSLLLEHISGIRRSAQEELLRLEQKKYDYCLEVPICLAPFLCMKPIENWGRGLTQDLSVYYDGFYGSISTLVIFLMVLSCFLLTFYCRFFGSFGKEGSRESQDLLLMRNPRIKAAYLCFLYRDYSKSLKKEDRLERLGWGRNLASFLEWKFLLGSLVGFGASAFTYCNREQFLTTLDRILPGDGGFILLVFFLGFFLGSLLPEIYLFFLGKQNQEARREEVLRLERVLLLLKDHPQVRGEQMLSYLRQFSFCYRKDLEQLEGNFLRKEDLEHSLSKVRKEELDFLFRGLDALDRIPVNRAFEGLSLLISFQEKKMQQEVSKREKDGAALSRVATFLPLFTTVGLYLVLPFVMEGLSKIALYNENFTTMMS